MDFLDKYHFSVFNALIMIYSSRSTFKYKIHINNLSDCGKMAFNRSAERKGKHAKEGFFKLFSHYKMMDECNTILSAYTMYRHLE